MSKHGRCAQGIVISIRPFLRPLPPQGDKTAQWKMGSVAKPVRPTDRARVACGCGICARTRAPRHASVSACFYVCIVHLHSSFLLNVFIGAPAPAIKRKPQLRAKAPTLSPHRRGCRDASTTYCRLISHVSNIQRGDRDADISSQGSFHPDVMDSIASIGLISPRKCSCFGSRMRI